ncbi:MAG: NAD+ synthase [Phycisphaerae bacterium]|nr:NAD+ synthase [Phycisphaerae bacterium]
MKIALAQINPTVGDIKANSLKIKQTIARARLDQVELVIFSELSLLGYPPKDLLLKPQFIQDNLTALKNLAAECTDIAALIGYADIQNDSVGKGLHNAAALLYQGKIQARYNKQLLPTYDVFDELRYFTPAESQQVIDFKGKRFGLTICEDIWQISDQHARRLYQKNPFADLADENIDLVINISASPFVIDKNIFRQKLFSEQCRKYNLPLLYVNQVGGNDELVFDGSSCAFSAHGELLAQAKDFAEDLLIIDLDDMAASRVETISTQIASVNKALVLGLADYVKKCRFKSVVLGLSGGIDSAVTAALAVEALGADKVIGVAMPSRYSSDHSVTDADSLARNLGIKIIHIPIEKAHAAMEETLAEAFAGTAPGVTEENIQARTRGNILMSLSNKFGHLLLTTGNKSELAVGYCTMYGDMAGGLAVISDVPKQMVYALARYINRNGQLIPESTITKPPSAELRPDQTDQDSLPPYEQLDDILQRYVEQEQSLGEIVAAGYDAKIVLQVARLVDRNEYKRKQAAPGLKVTSRAFGFGRRMPIAQNYQPYL